MERTQEMKGSALGDIGMHTADSLHCTAETNTAW